MISINALYISPNSLTWRDSREYCMNHCQSDLLSVHSENEENEANLKKRQVKNILFSSINIDISGNTWIGLNDGITSIKLINETNYEWSDGSNITYGTPMIPTSYSIQNTSIYLDNTFKANWINTDPSNLYTFMCNSCNSVLNKYIIIHNTTNWSNSRNICRSIVGTDLASIHSNTDHIEASLLCNECWIGLNKINNDNNNSNNNFTWSDGTKFVYGSYSNSGGWTTPPWSYNPDTNKCISYASINGWISTPCNSTKSILCYQPSELCVDNNYSEWYSLNPNKGILLFDKCQLNMIGDSMGIILNKHWMNIDDEVGSNNILNIEYIFRINEEMIINNHGDADFGIVVFNDANNSICSYLYIGFNIINGITKPFVLYIVNNSNIPTWSLTDNQQYIFEMTRFYELQVVITNYREFELRLDNSIIFTKQKEGDSDADAVGLHNSAKIGLKTTNLNITSKALYVSGDLTITSDQTSVISQWNTCPFPTPKPTLNPTMFTGTPTNIPTLSPTFKPTATPSFSPTKLGESGVTEHEITQSSTVIINDNDNTEEDTKNIINYILIIVGSIVVICLCILLFICYHKYKNEIELDDGYTKTHISMEMASGSAKTENITKRGTEDEEMEVFEDKGEELDDINNDIDMVGNINTLETRDDLDAHLDVHSDVHIVANTKDLNIMDNRYDIQSQGDIVSLVSGKGISVIKNDGNDDSSIYKNLTSKPYHDIDETVEDEVNQFNAMTVH